MSERSAITTVKIILWEREKWLKILNKSLLRWDHQEILTCYLLDDFLCDRKIALTKELYKIHSIFIKECRILKKVFINPSVEVWIPYKEVSAIICQAKLWITVHIHFNLYWHTFVRAVPSNWYAHTNGGGGFKAFQKKKMFQVWKPICWSLWHVEPALSAFCVWLWRMFEILDDVTTSIHF